MIIPQFGFSISPGAPLGVSGEAQEAEALGYARIGIWDSPALFRDPWVVLASMARDTRRISIGTWVTNPLTRHPVVTASAAASLDDLAPGRTYLGIGTGGTGVMHLGLKTARLAELENYVRVVRRLLEKGAAEHQDKSIRLEWAKRHIPILVAAHGPESLRLAGRVGDGVIIALGITPEVISGCLELLDQGAKEAGRRVEDLAVWFTSFWFVDPAPGVAKQQGRWAATSFASHFHPSDIAGKFVPQEYQAGLLRLGAAYDFVTHGAVAEAQKEAYAQLADKLGVADYVQRRFVFAGTPDEVEQQIRAAMQAGATCFDGAIDAPLPEHRERIIQWAHGVLDRFNRPPSFPQEQPR